VELTTEAEAGIGHDMTEQCQDVVFKVSAQELEDYPIWHLCEQRNHTEADQVLQSNLLRPQCMNKLIGVLCVVDKLSGAFHHEF